MEIGNPPVAYFNGGMGYNNPIRALIEETLHMWPSDRKIGYIVSIGTGVLISRDVRRIIKPLFDKLTEMATDTEKLARELGEEMKNIDTASNRRHTSASMYSMASSRSDRRGMDETKMATQNYLNSYRSRVEACSSQIFDQDQASKGASGG